ncbi:hypothetical protein C8J57DRAFT_1236011 [Mycena rebaudengoi]|nr:hypothetical protein C8J57DRAFT_1236011 [Mycena rebaudengoi]
MPAVDDDVWIEPEFRKLVQMPIVSLNMDHMEQIGPHGFFHLIQTQEWLRFSKSDASSLFIFYPQPTTTTVSLWQQRRRTACASSRTCGLGLSAVNALSTNKIAFKSKVVSRAYAEVWVEGASGEQFETFLNHVRLSPANTESRPHQTDILQGGAEVIYKSVKIRIELGREWQAGVNAFKRV